MVGIKAHHGNIHSMKISEAFIYQRTKEVVAFECSVNVSDHRRTVESLVLYLPYSVHSGFPCLLSSYQQLH